MKRGMNLGGVGAAPPWLVGVMVLLDRSGSMATICDAMEGAWRDFLHLQREIGTNGLWLTVHQFDGEGYDVVYDRAPLADVGALNLRPRGSTPLRDALWEFADHARAVIDDPADQTERLLLVVITDGEENASTKGYTWAQVRERLDGLESAQCEMIWMGTTEAAMEAEAQLPSFKAAGAMTTYAPSDSGAYDAVYTMSAAVTGVRSGDLARSAVATYTASGGRTGTTGGQTAAPPTGTANGLPDPSWTMDELRAWFVNFHQRKA